MPHASRLERTRSNRSRGSVMADGGMEPFAIWRTGRAVLQRLLCPLLLVVCIAHPVFAQGRWPILYTLPFEFYSTDMAPVEVTLGASDDPNVQNRAVLHLPRAYVVFA